jgi:hypothetical protein
VQKYDKPYISDLWYKFANEKYKKEKERALAL